MNKRILSIQSHVVSGYVGNKSATFPLQLLGYEVDPLNSVQFSNHTGYRNGWKGDVLNAGNLRNIVDGLSSNCLIKYDYLLTGYIGDPKFLLEIPSLYDKLIEHNKNLTYICDPVLGDNGKLYVPPSLVDIYKEKNIANYSDNYSNQFEAELLTGLHLESEEDVNIIMDYFHSTYHINTVVISSCEYGDGRLYSYASKMINGVRQSIKASFVKLNAIFVGTGDLFCALFLAWNDKYPNDLKLVCDCVLSTMQLILRKTYDFYSCHYPEHEDPAKWLELRLVQSHHEILEPKIIINSQTFD